MRYLNCILLTAICIFGSLAPANAKRKLPVTFVITYGRQPIQITDNQSLLLGDLPQVHTFRFYISGIELYQDGALQWKEMNSYHLLDASAPGSLQLSFNVPELLHFDVIRFNLGIDSATNVSGAMAGDLDPTRGMYWTWQSGYINLKLEGKSKVAPTHGKEFQFHLGGYAAPYASVQEVRLQTANEDVVTIEADVQQLLDGIDLATQNSIMVPGKEAVILSQKAVSMFSIRK